MNAILLAVFGAMLATGGLWAGAHAQEQEIPDWIKNNALWWAEGKISDSEYATALTWLAGQGIITIPQEQSTEQTQKAILPPFENLFKDWKVIKKVELMLQSVQKHAHLLPDGRAEEEEKNLKDGKVYKLMCVGGGIQQARMNLQNMLDDGTATQVKWDEQAALGNMYIEFYHSNDCTKQDEWGPVSKEPFLYWNER